MPVSITEAAMRAVSRLTGAMEPPDGIEGSIEQRASADMAALTLRYHDKNLHDMIAPRDPMARAAFDALESARLDLLGSRRMAGVEKNLRHALRVQSKQHKVASATPGDFSALPFILRAIARGDSLPASWKKFIMPKWQHFSESLLSDVHDQKSYALKTIPFLQTLGLDIPDPLKIGQDNPAAVNSDDDIAQDQTSSSTASSEDAAQQPDAMGEEADESNVDDASDAVQAAIASDNGTPSLAPSQTKSPRPSIGMASDYVFFTDEFDEIVSADQLANSEELIALRGQLDRAMPSSQQMIARLAARLERRLMAQQKRLWLQDQEEGILDPSRLSRLVANPFRVSPFRREKQTPFKDTAVILLLDNSGSMRGRPITMTALCADVLARTLERAGIKVEILGFTTKAWKGGDARISWQKVGSPAGPGRLNDLRHVVYKSFDTSWRRAKNNLGLMLKEGILKENIDGEALLWAAERLLLRREERKIMLVISDGAPVDDSTLSTNDSSYLEQHLKAAIAHIENKTAIDLHAIGIGHDVGRTYKSAVTIYDLEQLAKVLVEQLTELFVKN